MYVLKKILYLFWLDLMFSLYLINIYIYRRNLLHWKTNERTPPHRTTLTSLNDAQSTDVSCDLTARDAPERYRVRTRRAARGGAEHRILTNSIFSSTLRDQQVRYRRG